MTNETLPEHLEVDKFGTVDFTPHGSLCPTSGFTFTGDNPDVGTFPDLKNGVFVPSGKIDTEVTVTVTLKDNANYNDKTWTVKVTLTFSSGIYLKDDVGKITPYKMLQEAYILLPESGGTIYVRGNVLIDAGMTVTAGKPVTVQGEEGAVLTRTSDFTVFDVDAGAALTVNAVKVDCADIESGTSSLIQTEGNVTLSGVTILTGGAAQKGGAICVNGGKLTVSDNDDISANAADGNGGAIYVATDNVTVGNVKIGNNHAETFGNGVCVGGAIVKLAGSVGNLADGIAIAYDAEKSGTDHRGTVDVRGTLSGRLTVDFENPAKQIPADGAGDSALYVVSSSGANTTEALKSGMLVRNPGYTFKESEGGLSLTKADMIIAAVQDADGGWHDFADLQAAIDYAAGFGKPATVYLATYKNDQDP